MPLTIFAHSIETSKVKALLIEAGFEVTGDDEEWDASLEGRDGLFRKKKRMEVHYDLEYCSPPNWPQQISGMAAFFSNYPIPEESRDKIMRMIRSFRTSIGITLEPEPKDGKDPRIEIAAALAATIDGVFFLPSGSLVDPYFGTLIDSSGETDPEAEFPEIPDADDPSFVIPDLSDEEIEKGEGDDENEDAPEPDPPTPARVAARMLALAAVAARGLIDMNLLQGKNPAYGVSDVLDWVGANGIREELEPEELSLIETPAGKLPEQDVINAVWRLEGLAVLAWALNLFPLPRYDEVADADSLLAAVGFGQDADQSAAIRERAELQSPNALETYNNQIFALHWRLVDFRVRPEPTDFKKMESECWFGPLDLSWAEFNGDDLAVKGIALAKAKSDLVGTVGSIAAERHTASNWLAGQTPLYSDVDAST